MDIRQLIELFEIESGALNSLVRRHVQLRALFSRDFKGADLNALKLSYLQFLKMKADYVQFTCPAFRAAGEALSGGDEEDRRWSKVFLEYSDGETDEKEGARHPYAILGAKGVLEHLSIIMSDDIADGMLESRIAGAENAITFFRHHGVLDIEHVRGGDRNLERSLKDAGKIRQVFESVCFTSTVYRWMLESYVSRDESAANSISRPHSLAPATVD
jgi:hypothetical protein